MRKTYPSTIPMQYNNYHQRIITSTTSSQPHDASNFDDNQCISLFGEPIPPITGEFLDNLDNYLYGTVHQNNSKSNSYDLMNEFPRYNSFVSQQQRGNPPSSPRQLNQHSQHIIKDLSSNRKCTETHSNGIDTGGAVNLTPQIKILPNSSSSSGNITPIMNRNRKNFPFEPVDVDSDAIFETHRSNESEWQQRKKKRYSQNSDEFPNFTGLENQDDKEIKLSNIMPNRILNESYSNTDWFKPIHNYQEWSHIPKLRPSSKNVMSINQQNVQRESPVAVLLHDSNDSSSSGDKEPSPPIINLRQSQPLIQPKPVLYKTNSECTIRLPSEEYPIHLPPSGATAKREVSPVIVTNAIATGSDYRISTPRSHKKSSFTILSEKSPQNSRASSPLLQSNLIGRTSPFLGYGFKETPNLNKSRLSLSASSLKDSQQKISSKNFKLPFIEDTHRPSVQFDMSSSTKSQLPVTISSQSTAKDNTQNKKEKFLPLLRRNSVNSLEKIPKTTPGYLLRSASQKQLNKSSVDIYTDSKKAVEQKKPYANPNPTSRQRGLLQIITSADGSSKIPIRADSASLDDLRAKRSSTSPIQVNRRMSSTSPERRSSSQTERRSSIASDRRNSNISSVTASDFSFKKSLEFGSVILSDASKQREQINVNKIPQYTRNKNMKLPRKVAKPTTLSPIIGTPNKEMENKSGKINDLNEIDVTLSSKIPVHEISRQNSKINSRSNSRAPSTVNSRSNSPSKEYLIISRSNSRPTSRASLRNDSKAQSRSNSRLNSRQEPELSRNQNTSKRYKKNDTRSRSPNVEVTAKKSLSTTNLNSKSKNVTSNVKESKSNLVSKLKPSSSSISLKGNSTKSVNNSRESISAKKQNKTASKPDVNLRRTPSVSKRLTTPKDSNSLKSSFTLKKDSKKTSSNLKKEQVNNNNENSFRPLKRESSEIKNVPPLLKKDSSVKKVDVPVTRISSTKNKTDSSVTKKLEKKNSYKDKTTSANIVVDTESKMKEVTEGEVQTDDKTDTDSNSKLIPLTKVNVVSMTTAAITAQPVQITTAVTNQMPLTKTNSNNQLIASEDDESNIDMLPVAILEKSQKTLETIQKTVTVAADEIHKTINENLTDLKILENEVGKLVENASPVPSDMKVAPFEKSESLKTILEKPLEDSKQIMTTEIEKSMDDKSKVQKTTSIASTQKPVEVDVSVTNQKTSSNMQSDDINDSNGENNMNNNNMVSTLNTKNHSSLGKDHVAEDMSERVSERAISVLPEVECESANLQNYEDEHESGKDDATKNGNSNIMEESSKKAKANIRQTETQMIGNLDNGSGRDEIKSSGSQEEIINEDDHESTNCCGRRSKCCRCFSSICIPCRRCQISKCCRRNTNPEMIILNQNGIEKQSCWKKLMCCKRKNENNTKEMMVSQKRIETISEEPEVGSSSSTTQIGGDGGETTLMKRNKCYLCLNKFFCCRSINKINAITGEMKEVKKCCFCIPCRSKKKQEQTRAWQQERRESIISEPIPQRARSNRMLEKLMCWKKTPKPTESRRTSMNSKKQSIAPTLPPEDTRPKLHIDLVEFNSKMKGAIPVMPLWLAWFCMVCNCICPGLGTIFSGFFCLCVGIPRFSQYDSMKARIGSLIINCIVGISQLFCVLFCFVGWGWSIWWGMIMLKAARKLKKIKRVEQLEMEEEQRQASSVAAQRDRDVEAGKT